MRIEIELLQHGLDESQKIVFAGFEESSFIPIRAPTGDVAEGVATCARVPVAAHGLRNFHRLYASPTIQQFIYFADPLNKPRCRTQALRSKKAPSIVSLKPRPTICQNCVAEHLSST